jgi:hypothetical protein
LWKEDEQEQHGHDGDGDTGSSSHRTPGGRVEDEAEEVGDEPDQQRHEEQQGPDRGRYRERDLGSGSLCERRGRHRTAREQGTAESEEGDDHHQHPAAEQPAAERCR